MDRKQEPYSNWHMQDFSIQGTHHDEKFVLLNKTQFVVFIEYQHETQSNQFNQIEDGSYLYLFDVISKQNPSLTFEVKDAVRHPYAIADDQIVYLSALTGKMMIINLKYASVNQYNNMIFQIPEQTKDSPDSAPHDPYFHYYQFKHFKNGVSVAIEKPYTAIEFNYTLYSFNSQGLISKATLKMKQQLQFCKIYEEPPLLLMYTQNLVDRLTCHVWNVTLDTMKLSQYEQTCSGTVVDAFLRQLESKIQVIFVANSNEQKTSFIQSELNIQKLSLNFTQKVEELGEGMLYQVVRYMKNKVLFFTTKYFHAEKQWKDEVSIYNIVQRKKIKKELIIESNMVPIRDETNEVSQQILLYRKEDDTLMVKIRFFINLGSKKVLLHYLKETNCEELFGPNEVEQILSLADSFI